MHYGVNFKDPEKIEQESLETWLPYLYFMSVPLCIALGTDWFDPLLVLSKGVIQGERTNFTTPTVKVFWTMSRNHLM